MTSSPQLRTNAWIALLLCSLVFLGWFNHRRAQHVEYVTGIDSEGAAADPHSPTGYADGLRWLIVPEHNNRSYQWIAETQQMLARGEWRLRHIDYENAPWGREVSSASPYRWWLGLIAWCHHQFTGRPLGQSAEKAALWADPLLHLLFLAGTSVFVARRFGPYPAAVFVVGATALFPFADNFVPGSPDEKGLARILALWSVLLLIPGILDEAPKKLGVVSTNEADRRRNARRWFFLAGVVGGLGLWINVAVQTPVVVGVALGALLSIAITRFRTRTGDPGSSAMLPWRTWAFGGATTCLATYLLEYYPAHLDFRLETNHPVYGLAWVGIGEILILAEAWRSREKFAGNYRRMVGLVLALAAIAILPVAMHWQKTQGFLLNDPLDSHLTNSANGTLASSLSAWLMRDGLTGTLVAVLLPVLLVGPVIWTISRHNIGIQTRSAMAVVLGPVLAALWLAYHRIAWWNMVDATLVVLAVAAAAALQSSSVSARLRGFWTASAALLVLPGLFHLRPPAATSSNNEFTPFELEGLIERACAQWIAERAGPDGATVLLPPDRTVSWCFHGGLRGVGTANWENRAGLAATVRIATATSAAEALTLIKDRGIRYLILPSWDPDLDEFARWSLRNPEDAFIMALHHWALPPWLRPVPYKLPEIAGFESQSIVVLEVVEETNRVAALARLAEYFVETQRMDLAVSSRAPLQRYPTDLNALIALAELEKAAGDVDAQASAFAAVLSSVAGGLDRSLAWDRRVSLAVVLAQGGREDLAREQVRRCLEKLDASRLRSLTTASLYRLLVMSKTFGLELPDPKLRELAAKLLPVELRGRL
jgi:hypothetical protein